MDEGSISRRNFVKTAYFGGNRDDYRPRSGADERRSAAGVPGAQPTLPKTLIGIQVEVNSLQNNLVQFLDDVQTRASVNTLMMHCVPFEASWAGLDRASNPLGNFATAHPQYYRRYKNEAPGAGPGRLQPSRDVPEDQRRNQKTRHEDYSVDGGGQSRAPGNQGL